MIHWEIHCLVKFFVNDCWTLFDLPQVFWGCFVGIFGWVQSPNTKTEKKNSF